ncbi:MAG: MFS transporter [Succinivibrionaceae bacterium]|nr:MFS transporter [Succinivibrionaceae bacterium]
MQPVPYQKESLLFMLGHFATDISHGSLPVILAYMFQAGRIGTYSEVALLLMANTIINALVQPLAGLLADSRPRPWLMSVGIFFSFLGVMLIGVTHDQAPLYFLVCLNGLGSAIFHPAGGKMANVFGKARLGRNMSIFSVGGNAGMAAGPFYFTAFYVLFSLDATLMMCLPGIVMIAIFLRRNRYYTLMARRDQSRAEHARGRGGMEEDRRGFLLLLALLFLRSSGWFSLTAFLALYLMHRFGVQDELAAIINGVAYVFGTLATFLGGTISDRFGFRRLVVVSSFAAVPFALGFALSPSALLATLSLIPLAFLFFAGMSPCVVLGQKFLCRHVGMSTGFTIGLSMSFGGLVAPILGKVGDTYGVGTIMYCVAGLLSAAALCSLLLPRPAGEGA